MKLSKLSESGKSDIKMRKVVGIGAVVGLCVVAIWLATRQAVKKLREKNMVRIITTYGSLIKKYAKQNEVDPHWIAAIIMKESGGYPNVTSNAGAKGLMQVLDSTAAELGFPKPPLTLYDPETSIAAGTKYFSKQLKKFRDIRFALAAYNAGPGSMQECVNKTVVCPNGIPIFDETQKYVPKVIAYYNSTTKDIWNEVV